MGLKNKRILVGVTGSISAYKACDLVQRLKDQGAVVRVIMTHSATLLVHPNTFAALTGAEVAVHPFSGAEHGRMEHISLARWADIFLIAPCTAHTLAEFAQGLTGSILSLVYQAYTGRVFIAPAMNSVMWESPALRRNLSLLSSKGDIILPTGEGVLACGEIGYGKLLDVSQIIAYLKSQLILTRTYSELVGKKVLISLGHTQEKWDDVRFISNRSSGKTGLALARVLQLAGAKVQLVAGIVEEELPAGIDVIRVKASAEFQKEMLNHQGESDIVIMAAAIADFVPDQVFEGKKKGSKTLNQITLKAFPNILNELGERKPPEQLLVGFALETEEPLAHGLLKMHERHCDIMVVNNPVATETGFGKDRVLAAILTKANTGAGAGADTYTLDKTNSPGINLQASPTLVEMSKDHLAESLAATLQSLLSRK